MSDSAELWQAHNELREKYHALESRMSAHDANYNAIVEKLDLSRKERNEQFQTLATEIRGLAIELAERRGAVRIAAWIVGLLIALGVPAAWIASIGGGKT